MMYNYEMIVFDIGNTLFNKRYEKELSPFIKKDLIKLHQKGIKIGIYSMRSYAFCKQLFNGVPLDFYISLNGSLIITQDVTLFDHPLEIRNLPLLTPCLTYDKDHTFYNCEEAKVFAENSGFIAQTLGVSATPYNVVLFEVDENRLGDYKEKFHCEYWKKTKALAIQNPDDSRTNAIKKVLEFYSITSDPLIFGDGPNDVEVFKQFKHGISVGNECIDLVNYSMDQTLPATELGVSIALRKLGIIEKDNAYVFAFQLPPYIGGVESHGHYLIQYLTYLYKVHVISKDGQKDILVNDQPKPFNIGDVPNSQETLLFFNSGHWIETMNQIRHQLDKVFIMYRTGGNEIPMAPLNDMSIPYPKRVEYWVHTLNTSVDMLITNSEFTENRLIALGINPNMLKRMVGGVDFNMIKKYKEFGPLFINQNEFPIVSASRFVPYKRIDLILETFKLLESKYHLYLIGDGPLLRELKEKFEHLENVTFMGKRTNEEVLNFIAHASLYIQASGDTLTSVPGGSYIHTEGMGRSIIEAISCGTFVISTQAGALNEIIHSDMGTIVEDNPRLIAQTIINNVKHRPLHRDFYPYAYFYLFKRYLDEWKKY